MADVPLESGAAVRAAESVAETVAAPQAASADAEPWPHPARAWYTLVILTFALMFSILDRSIMSLMIQPIERDLHINDTEVSLLLGLAFVCIYAFLSLPIARIADTTSRKVIIGLGLGFWSIMTAMCGLAQGYWMLFAARMGVGAGESSYAPATYSILADYFPRDKLAEATGFLANGYNYGVAMALILGGAVIGAVERMPDTIIPGIGVMHPWQWAFVAVGVPGLLLALLFQVTVKEPKRRGVARAQAGTKPKAVPIRAVFKFLLSDWRTFGPIFAANAIRSLGAGVAVWIPTFYIRTYHWTAPQVGLIQGLMLLCISPLGIWLGGKLSERWTRKGMWDCNMRITFLAGLTALPFGILYPLMPYGWLALTLSGASLFIAAVSTGPAVAALQLIVPNQMRGQINSLNLLIFNIISAGIGPTFVTLFTDYLFKNPADLRYSIVLIALLLNPIATFVIFLGIKPYGRSAKRAAEQFA